jgi:signal transduction histidine kinase
LVTAQDVTQRKQTERNLIVAHELALQTSQYKSEFLANVSHEIRTPLNGIIGMVDVLGHTALSDKQKEYVDIIRVSADSQLDVVGKVLDFSKIEIGKMVIAAHVIDTRELAAEMASLIAPRAAMRKLTFKSELDRSVPPMIVADEVRLKQIMKNLLENAIKFTQKGGISLRVAMLDSGSSPRLRVDVEDTGIGVPESLRSHLFTPFYQVDSSLTRKYGGTGLGLAICKQLAVLMGGEIGFNSVEGSGSTFWFSVPVEIPATQNGLSAGD